MHYFTLAPIFSESMPIPVAADKIIHCYHCGEDCHFASIYIEDKSFCCEGCKMVYQILNQNDLCDYYDLNKTPGISQRVNVRKINFLFLMMKRYNSNL
ncbi:MAG: heavy metal translocating P-type ATPase metal-binding domain-containing protein [Bacteroidota bacterium]